MIHYLRGVLLGLLLLLSICVVVFVVAEGVPVGKSVYLTLITALTIGYGDITPVTTVGRVASVVTGFIGLIYVGVNVAIATRALSRVVEDKKREKKPPPST
jgi:voltage-gated potassium channel